MSLEINWTPYIKEDFLEYRFSDEQLLKVKEKIKLLSRFPYRLEKVKGFPKDYDIRKVRYRNFRIFLLLDFTLEKIDCLRMFSNHKGYKEKHMNQILTIASKVYNN